jgi:transcription termination/antitermination protein NusG
MDEFKWYVVRATSGQEKKVKGYIEAELDRENLRHLVPQILIPTEKVRQERNGKKIIKEKNYFPGYILIEAKLEGELEHTIKNVSGVIGFLAERGIPAPMRKNEINRILGIVDDLAEAGESLSINFLHGEYVKVLEGPFKGFNGVIEEINEEKRKLKVVVTIFGRKTPVELNYTQVEKE